MGLPWIEIQTNLPTHPKSLALGVVLRNKRAWTHMLELWLWAGEHCQDGRLSARNGSLLIEHAAGWDGEPGALVDAAVRVGFIDRQEDGVLILHGWDERNAAHVAKLERDAARQKERRLRVASKFSAPVVTDPSAPSPLDVQPASAGRPLDGAGSHADVAGNSNSKTNTNTNTNPLPSEEKDPPADVPRIPITPERPTTPEESWGGFEFWTWCQTRRMAGSYLAERPPRRDELDRWWSACLMTPGVTVRAMMLGFTRGFGKDEFWEAKGFPFAAFKKGWDRYVRPEAPHAVAG